ncbi:hypothetical protein SYNPS1DRAFT_28066 [Syncephalis pseudoplumigaleata]|uniref:Uncharacterized protein n=1 Tax=Syncephalis pseudoplumigaleata TaxID=1712513 RepID=A0A4V1J1U0_9FUNG|nr:hypothetical protein SYNPS1DRAFT_28066 [Syncephalis pseudoplumigaleata]|eukprot:RKP26229.1 hypothetical protein SYNPS1DRAFT_28066 [Syncephalis pseudoplumigaleata]
MPPQHTSMDLDPTRLEAARALLALHEHRPFDDGHDRAMPASVVAHTSPSSSRPRPDPLKKTWLPSEMSATVTTATSSSASSPSSSRNDRRHRRAAAAALSSYPRRSRSSLVPIAPAPMHPIVAARRLCATTMRRMDDDKTGMAGGGGGGGGGSDAGGAGCRPSVHGTMAHILPYDPLAVRARHNLLAASPLQQRREQERMARQAAGIERLRQLLLAERSAVAR